MTADAVPHPASQATPAAAADSAPGAAPGTAPTAAAAAESGVGAADACGEQLRRRFPALFGGAPKPVKLRIQADIQARAPGEFTKAALSGFLRWHTGRTAYLLALTRAPHRFDLDGAAAGEISAEHRQAAVDELERRRTLRAEREAAQMQQRRQRAELLRAFEGSSLSAANFCALKGLAEHELPALLDAARRERDEQRAQAAAPRERAGQARRQTGPALAAPRRPARRP